MKPKLPLGVRNRWQKRLSPLTFDADLYQKATDEKKKEASEAVK